MPQRHELMQIESTELSKLAVPLLCGLLFLAIGQIGYGQPAANERHDYLKKEVGTWNAVMKMYMQPGAEPVSFPAVETNTMFGKLWLVTVFDAGPFKGRGQMGYDPRKKKFVGTWVDNMSDHLNIMEGEHNDTTGETIMFSDSIDAETNKPQKTKSVTKFQGDDAKTMIMYNQATDGTWNKAFEITYERKK